MRMPTIYGFMNGMMPDGKFIVTAATEDGETVCSVVVNNEIEGMTALGMDGSQNRHLLYEERRPDGFRLEWVRFRHTSVHPGIRELVRAHHEKRKLTA